MKNKLGMINAFDPAHADTLDAHERQIVERRQRLLGPAYRLFYDHPLHVVRGEGTWLYGPKGERYLDVYNNVPSVGHCHPHVTEAVAKQMATLNTHTRYMHDGILDYAEMLLGTFPPELSQVMFTCTGSEANDLAVRVAKQATGGTGFIVTKLAYHGVTETIAGMSPSLGENAPRTPHVYHVAAPLSSSMQTGDVGQIFARAVEAALDDMRRLGIKPAGLLVDTIFSSDGVFADPAGFLAPAAAAIRKAGGLFIADEVQPGFARTGEKFWGFQRHGLVPDLVTMGKPMGNGYPVAALVARPEYLEAFGKRVRYFNTFGGSPVAMAAARAVFEVINQENLQAHVHDTGSALLQSLHDMKSKHALISDVRGVGFFIGVELSHNGAPASAETAAVVNGLRERHVLISASGPHANVLKIRPPLCFGKAEAAVFLTALEETLQEVETREPQT